MRIINSVCSAGVPSEPSPDGAASPHMCAKKTCVMKQQASVAAAIPERNQSLSFSDDGVLPCSQEASHGSHVSLPPTPPRTCHPPASFPHRQVSSVPSQPSMGSYSVPVAFDSPQRRGSSLSQRLQRLGSNLHFRSVNSRQFSQVLVLGLIAVALYVGYPFTVNRAFSCVTGCSPALIGHLRSLGLQQHAQALCSKGYNRLSDLLHSSEQQYAPFIADFTTICFLLLLSLTGFTQSCEYAWLSGNR